MKQVIASVLFLLVLGLAPHEAHAYCTTPAPVWSDLHPVRIVIHPDMHNYLRHAYHGPDLVENNMRSCTTSADCGTDGLCVTGYTTAPVNRCRGPRWTRGELERAVQWVVSRINQDSGADLPLVYVDTNGISSCSLVDDCDDSARPWMNCFQSDTIVLIPAECDPALNAAMDVSSATWTGLMWADWGDRMQRNKLIRVASSNSRDNDPRLGLPWSHYSRSDGLSPSAAQNFELALLHEMGHALGLGHVTNDYPGSVPNCLPNTTSPANSVCPMGTGIACAVMGSCSNCGEGRAVHLHSYGYDDMQGLVALYGLESTADTRLFEDWDLASANFVEWGTSDLPLITNIAAGAIPATSATTVVVGGRTRDSSFMERFQMFEWDWLSFSSTLRATAWIPGYRSTGPIAISVSPTHRVLSSHALRLTSDATRYRRRIHDIRDSIAAPFGYVTAVSSPTAGSPEDTSVGGVSAAYHAGTGATVHVIRDNLGQILIQAYRTSSPTIPPGPGGWSNVFSTGVYSFAHPSIACSPNRCFIAFTEMPFPASPSRETRMQWMEGTFSWGVSSTSFAWTNLSGVNTTWNNITSDPVASVVANPAGGWYFYVAVALPARIDTVWGSRVYVYRRAEASTGALSLLLPQVADFPGVFVQPAAAGAGGYAEVFTSSSF